MYIRKCLLGSFTLVLCFLIVGCGSSASNKNASKDVQAEELTMDDFTGFWFSEEAGPIEIKMLDDTRGEITYINVEENVSYAFENLKVSEDNISVLVTGMIPELDTVDPYTLKFSKPNKEDIEIYNEAIDASFSYSEASESYVRETFQYEGTNDKEIKEFEEQNDVTVIMEGESDLEITQGDSRIPDVVVYEYASPNVIGRRILESFFEKEGLTYYYYKEMNRTPALIQFYKPIEERDYRIDIMMDYEIEYTKVNDLDTEHMYFTTPFRQIGDKDKGNLWYYSFALPKENEELYMQLEDYVREIMANGEYQTMFAQGGSGNTIVIPKGMDWKDFVGE